MGKRAFTFAKTKTQITFAVTLSALWYRKSLFFKVQNFKTLSIFRGCAARVVSDLVKKPEGLFSHSEAQCCLLLLKDLNLFFSSPEPKAHR